MTNARNGVIRFVSWNGRNVPEDGRVIMIGRDVTEDRIFDEKLRQTQKMEAIGQLTGGIAHDFNNLLAAISGSLEMMNKRIEQNKPELIGKYISAAQQASHRAAQLTQRLLAFSRRQSLAPVPVCANDLITSMQDLLDRSIGPSITLKSNLPEIWCTLCDPNQLENGLLNCVINSRDAMPDGGTITISTQNVATDHCAVYDIPAGDYVLISVKDNGSGMPPDVISRAFDPFYTTKPIGKGTGLGLSMLYGFVNQSNGHIKIVSKVGRGTTIRIFLPRHSATVKPVVVETNETISLEGTPEQTILVVEDEPLVRDVLVELMQSCGFTTLEAGDADEAMPYVANRQQRIDLLLSDVGLPGINGRQLAELARQHRPEVKVLFITGFAPTATVRDQFLAEGMDMMTKPFEVDAVVERVAKMLRDD